MNKERVKFTSDLYFFFYIFIFFVTFLSVNILWFTSDEPGKVCTELKTLTNVCFVRISSKFLNQSTLSNRDSNSLSS